MTKKELEILDNLDPSNDFEIPDGWCCKRLRDGLLNDIQTGFACGENTRDGEGIPHLRPMNVNKNGNIDLSDVKFVPLSKCTKPGCFIELDDVIFNNTNSPTLVGKTAHYKLSERKAFSNHMTRLRCKKEIIDPIFCAMILHQKWREGYFESVCNNHVSQSSVGRDVLLDTKIPLPPLPEQHRIVAKVEELFKEVDAAHDRLKRVPEIIKHFRQAVLAAACSGRLTEGWREYHQDIQNGKYLLEGITGKKSTPSIPDDDDDPPLALPEIPDTWVWTRCFTLCNPNRDITYGVIKLGPPIKGGVPTLRSSDVRWLNIDDSNVKLIDPNIASQYSRTFLKGGEIVITVRGSLGGVAVVPQSMSGYNISREVAVFPLPLDFDSNFFSYAIASIWSQNWLSEVTKGVAYTGINIRDLKRLPLPLPPLEEQHEIVRRVESLFALADEIKRQVVAATKHTDGLRQAILAKAFRGELVPTDAELSQGIHHEG